MNNILNTILKDTFSLSQYKHRLRILKSNLLRTFFGGENKDNLSLSPADLAWLKSLPSDFYQNFNKDNVYEIFSYLEETSDKFPILTIHLAFEPDETALKQIGLFGRKTFEMAILLDIKLDPKLIGGAVLSFKGVLRDYSLRARIEQRKDEILQGFKRFLR